MLYYPSGPPAEQPPPPTPPSSGRARLAWVIAAITVAALIVFGLGWASGSAYSDHSHARTAAHLPSTSK